MHHYPPRLTPNFCLLLALWLVAGNFSQAQTSATSLPGVDPAVAKNASRLDVSLKDSKLLTVDHAIDDFSLSTEGVLKVDKVEGVPNQLTLYGLASGDTLLTVKSNGLTYYYAVSVTPGPERLYINIPESQRLTFINDVDDTSVSVPGIVRVVQPDDNQRVLLLEALNEGQTTLTVFSKGSIYRYFISTFTNRGADVLEIEKAFTAKGYHNLTITFTNDQAVINGTVPTQEELDDAVRIVKQFTDYVLVKATLGDPVTTQIDDEYTDQEKVIISNIQRIANVKGLIVRVKFPEPQVTTTSTSTRSTGDILNPTTAETNAGGTVVRGGGFIQQTGGSNNNPQSGNGPLEQKPLQNTTETTTVVRNTSLPEKIFLYGDMEDDLEEARVIRVARCFCPYIVSFLTIKDPIQLRTHLRFMQVDDTKSKQAGVDWSNDTSGIQVALGYTGATITGSIGSVLSNLFGQNFAGFVNASAVLHLLESENTVKLVRESEIYLTNGQPGWYSEGELQTYVASTNVTAQTTGTVLTINTSQIFLGINLNIAPLGIADAGGQSPQAQQILGVSSGIGSYTVTTSNEADAEKVDSLSRPIEQGGQIPVVDSSHKYVDENGLIGMNIAAQVTVPNGAFQTLTGASGTIVTLPDVFVRTNRIRVNLRDNQTVVLNGLIDQQTSAAITAVPFFSKIPILGALFRNKTDAVTRQEILVLVTPEIVRMRDPENKRFPRPHSGEMEDMAREYGDVPQVAPTLYDKAQVQLRPVQPAPPAPVAPIPLAEAAPLPTSPVIPAPISPVPGSLPPIGSNQGEGIAPTAPVDKLAPPSDNSMHSPAAPALPPNSATLP